MLNDHSLVLGGVIATAALLGACAGGAIGDGNGEARAGTSFDGPDFGGPDFVDFLSHFFGDGHTESIAWVPVEATQTL